jgi:hypothetical protein
VTGEAWGAHEEAYRWTPYAWAEVRGISPYLFMFIREKQEQMKTTQHDLFQNPYPGRTLIAGMTPSGSHYVQVYWITGRSTNSRNRVFEKEGVSLRNKAFDPALKGIGHCLHTYKSEVDGVLKPFQGDPFEVPLFDSINEIADYYWERINKENKIALLVKFVAVQNQEIHLQIRNKHCSTNYKKGNYMKIE